MSRLIHTYILSRKIILPAALCLFMLLGSSTQLRAQKSAKEVKRELRKEQRKQAREEAKKERELALYNDSDFHDDADSGAGITSVSSKRDRSRTKRNKTRSERSTAKTERSAEPRAEISLSADDQIERYAYTLQGIPYKYGGMSKSGFDCSGFSCHVFSEAGVKVPRTAQAQYDAAQVVSLRKVKKGDLVFFGKSKNKISHVGIVISEQGKPLQMIHASTSMGIMITDVDTNTYWKPKLIAAGRYLDEDRASR